MRKNFLLVGAMLVAGTFLGADVAKAADIKFSGSTMARYEMFNRDLNDSTEVTGQIGSRIRLNASANIDEKTSAFLQMQGVGVFGDNAATTANQGAVNRGGAAVSDTLNDVGFHQAFFTLKNFYDMPVDLKLGRQEIILDGHRLIGNTIWTLGMQAHDAIRLTHSHGDHTFVYAFSKIGEGDRDSGDGAGTVRNTAGANGLRVDQDAHIFWGNFKGIGGGALSLYYVMLDIDDDVLNAGSTFNDNIIHTIGFRQAGNIAGFDYRGEFYYQWGDADGSATQQTLNAGSWDREAVMIGARLGKQFGPLKATLWYDYVSGTDEGDASGRTVGSFDTLFDTGHKFYGLMDNFLQMGTASRTARDVQEDGLGGLGLQDIALKTSYKMNSKWKMKFDFHSFFTAEDAYVAADTTAARGAVATALANGSNNDGSSHLGEEIDISLHHKYSQSTSVVVGYSHFFADDLGNELIGRSFGAGSVGTGNPNSTGDGQWAYVMMNVNF